MKKYLYKGYYAQSLRKVKTNQKKLSLFVIKNGYVG